MSFVADMMPMPGSMAAFLPTMSSASNNVILMVVFIFYGTVRFLKKEKPAFTSIIMSGGTVAVAPIILKTKYICIPTVCSLNRPTAVTSMNWKNLTPGCRVLNSNAKTSLEKSAQSNPGLNNSGRAEKIIPVCVDF